MSDEIAEMKLVTINCLRNNYIFGIKAAAGYLE